MSHNIYVSIFAVALVIFATRVLPLTLIRKPITNPFLKSFLHYVPYITLAVMTFPAIVDATCIPVAGAAALLVGIFMAWRGSSLITVAVSCSAAVLFLELIL